MNSFNTSASCSGGEAQAGCQAAPHEPGGVSPHSVGTGGQIGMAGLGRVGANMASRLSQGGHRVVGFDPDPEARQAVQVAGAASAASLDELVAQLATPRTLWVMVPSGDPVESTMTALSRCLARGDPLIGGGNSRYTDAQRLARQLADKGVALLDCGTIGGVRGLQEGYSLMAPQ